MSAYCVHQFSNGYLAVKTVCHSVLTYIMVREQHRDSCNHWFNVTKRKEILTTRFSILIDDKERVIPTLYSSGSMSFPLCAKLANVTVSQRKADISVR